MALPTACSDAEAIQSEYETKLEHWFEFQSGTGSFSKLRDQQGKITLWNCLYEGIKRSSKMSPAQIDGLTGGDIDQMVQTQAEKTIERTKTDKDTLLENVEILVATITGSGVGFIDYGAAIHILREALETESWRLINYLRHGPEDKRICYPHKVGDSSANQTMEWRTASEGNRWLKGLKEMGYKEQVIHLEAVTRHVTETGNGKKFIADLFRYQKPFDPRKIFDPPERSEGGSGVIGFKPDGASKSDYFDSDGTIDKKNHKELSNKLMELQAHLLPGYLHYYKAEDNPTDAGEYLAEMVQSVIDIKSQGSVYQDLKSGINPGAAKSLLTVVEGLIDEAENQELINGVKVSKSVLATAGYLLSAYGVLSSVLKLDQSISAGEAVKLGVGLAGLADIYGMIGPLVERWRKESTEQLGKWAGTTLAERGARLYGAILGPITDMVDIAFNILGATQAWETADYSVMAGYTLGAVGAGTSLVSFTSGVITAYSGGASISGAIAAGASPAGWILAVVVIIGVLGALLVGLTRDPPIQKWARETYWGSNWDTHDETDYLNPSNRYFRFQKLGIGVYPSEEKGRPDYARQVSKFYSMIAGHGVNISNFTNDSGGRTRAKVGLKGMSESEKSSLVRIDPFVYSDDSEGHVYGDTKARSESESFEANVVPISLDPWVSAPTMVDVRKAIDQGEDLPLVHLNGDISAAMLSDNQLIPNDASDDPDESGNWMVHFYVDSGTDRTYPIFAGDPSELTTSIFEWSGDYSSWVDVSVLDFNLIKRVITADPSKAPSSWDLAQLPSALHYTAAIEDNR